MKVRKGFSTKYAEDKFDVELDEADLSLMLEEHQIPPEQLSKVTTLQAFRLLNTLAEWLMLTEMVKFKPEAADKVGPARAAYYATADSVRTELGLEPIYTAFLATQQPAGAPG